MEELIEKLEVLKKDLDETICVKKIKTLVKEIKQDKELITLIEKYNYTKDERIREKILENQLYREYKHQEAELNFLILEINQSLKSIIKKDNRGL